MNPDATPAALANPVRPLAAALGLLLLGGCSLLGIRTAEEASYAVVASQDDIELRDYASYVSVETTVSADFDDAGNRAFRKLFGYISGDNRAQEKIAMTSPVTASESTAGDGEEIEMTIPVIASERQRGWRFAFVLPGRFTIDSAPLPLDPDVELVENRPRRVAVLTFSGRWREAAFRDNLERLLGWIEKNGYEAASSPRFAGYDPPWALPFMRRNEIIIDLEPTS